MRVALLQFAPQLGVLEANIARADALLAEAEAEGRLVDVDLLVGPELALTGRF